jgi:hypothetical protein
MPLIIVVIFFLIFYIIFIQLWSFFSLFNENAVTTNIRRMIVTLPCPVVKAAYPCSYERGGEGSIPAIPDVPSFPLMK